MPTAQCRPVLGSGVQCAVQTWNQSSSGAISSIKMNSFVQKPWPASSGPPDGASCAPAFVSPSGAAATSPCFNRSLG